MRQRVHHPLLFGLIVVGVSVVAWMLSRSDLPSGEVPTPSRRGVVPAPPHLVGRADPSIEGERVVPAPRRCGVFGRVVTDRGVPIGDATLEGGPVGRTRSGGDGRFRLQAAATELRVSALGYESQRLELALDSRGGCDVGDIVLIPAGVVTVRVVDDHDRPVAGANVDWAFPRSDHEILNPRRNPLHGTWTWHPLGETDETGSRSGAVPGGRALAFRARLGGALILTRPTRPPFDGAVVIRVPTLHALRVVARFRATDRPMTPVHVTRLDGPPQQRWRRTYENPEGELAIALPAGLYEISVLAAGRRRLGREVQVPRDREARLELDDVQRLRVRAKGGGNDVDEFLVQTRRGRLPPGIAASLLYGTTPVQAVDGTALLELPFGDDLVAPEQLWLLVAAPGWRMHRRRIPWNGGIEDHEVVVELAGAAAVLGTLPDSLRSAREVRLYARSIDDAGHWDATFAPLVSADGAPEAGAFRLPTIGPGLYEIRVLMAGREALAGTCRVDDTDVRLTEFVAPATLILDLDASGQEAPPLLHRRLDLSGWSVGTPHARRAIPGTLVGSELRFEGLSPGAYTLARSDASIAPPRLAQAGEAISLDAGEVLRRSWAPAGPVRTLRATVHLPEALAGGSASVAFVAESDAPRLLPSLTWVDVQDGGDAEIVTLASGPGFVVVADAAGLGPQTPKLFAAPLSVTAVGATDLSVHVRVPAPGRLRVGGAPDTRVVLMQQDLVRVLGLHVWLRPDEMSPPLVPGAWRVEWYHAHGGGLLHTRTVDLSAGETRTLSPP